MKSVTAKEAELDELGKDRMDDESMSFAHENISETVHRKASRLFRRRNVSERRRSGRSENSEAALPGASSHERVKSATDATASAMQPQRLVVNAHEAPEAFVVVASMPAVVPDDVTIELDHGLLRITARLRSSGPRDYVLHEWEYGGYEREIALPEAFGRGIEASLTNGQLVVRVLRGRYSKQISIQPHAT